MGNAAPIASKNATGNANAKSINSIEQMLQVKIPVVHIAHHIVWYNKCVVRGAVWLFKSYCNTNIAENRQCLSLNAAVLPVPVWMFSQLTDSLKVVS